MNLDVRIWNSVEIRAVVCKNANCLPCGFSSSVQLHFKTPSTLIYNSLWCSHPHGIKKEGIKKCSIPLEDRAPIIKVTQHQNDSTLSTSCPPVCEKSYSIKVVYYQCSHVSKSLQLIQHSHNWPAMITFHKVGKQILNRLLTAWSQARWLTWSAFISSFWSERELFYRNYNETKEFYYSISFG